MPQITGSQTDRRRRTAGRCVAVLLLSAAAASADEQYPTPSEWTLAEGVEAGRIEGPFEFRSEVFPDTVRQYWVYVPAGYEASKPACLCVVQDGLGKAQSLRLPTVFDNLIAEGSMPVTLGLFITPGVVPVDGDGAQPRFNRSFEYDSMGPRYATLLVDELLPEVRLSYAISDDPNDRMICGSSSGGVCAWTVAWERPDEFRRVFSSVGTFVGLRGADAYPVLVRKHEPKPIRVFLQDGSADLDIYAGSWWHANQAMLSALQWADYDVEHVWGEGGHNGQHAAAIFPKAVRWLWRDYPDPVEAGHAETRRMDILIEGEDWELVSEGYGRVGKPAAGPDGEVYFPDAMTGAIFRVGGDGRVETLLEAKSPEEVLEEARQLEPRHEWRIEKGLIVRDDPELGELEYGPSRERIVRLAAGPGDTLYGVGFGGLARVSPDGTIQQLRSTGFGHESDLVVTDDSIYGTVAGSYGGYVIRCGLDGEDRDFSEVSSEPRGLTTTADAQFLWVSDAESRWVSHIPLTGDGAFRTPGKDTPTQKFGYLHLDPMSQDSGGGRMVVDSQGRAYVATSAGVQVMDQLGRVHLVLAAPNRQTVTDLCFGGPDRDVVYAAAGDRLYRRRLRTRGHRPSEGPAMPPKPGL